MESKTSQTVNLAVENKSGRTVFQTYRGDQRRFSGLTFTTHKKNSEQGYENHRSADMLSPSEEEINRSYGSRSESLY